MVSYFVLASILLGPGTGSNFLFEFAFGFQTKISKTIYESGS